MLLSFDFLSFMLVILILIIIYRIYINSDTFQLKCIVSDINGKKYCVREREKIEAAADRLAQVNDKMIKLVDYCIKTYPSDERCKRLVKNFNPDKIVEIVEKYIDYDKIFKSSLENKLQDFYNALGYGKVPANDTLNDFFSF